MAVIESPAPLTVGIPSCTVDAVALKRALARVKSAVAARGNMPIRRGVLIVFDGDEFRLTASDGDLTLTTTIPAETEVFGRFVVNHASLAMFVQAATTKLSGPVKIIVNAEDCNPVVSFDGLSLRLEPLPAAEWPRADEHDSDAAVSTVNLDAIADVLPAAATDYVRPILNSVLIDGSSVVATDSYRLYVVDGMHDTGVKVRVPLNAAKVLAKIGGTAQGTFSLYSGALSCAHASFTTPDLDVSCRLGDGEFPNYRRLIPEPTGSFLPANLDEFRKAIDAVSKLAKQMGYGEPIRLKDTGEGCRISVLIPDKGAIEQVVAGQFGGSWADEEIAFNPIYLKALLDGVKSGSLEGVDRRRPALVREPFGDGTRIRLLMPVRTP